jgi:hypothetical protein
MFNKGFTKAKRDKVGQLLILRRHSMTLSVQLDDPTGIGGGGIGK